MSNKSPDGQKLKLRETIGYGLGGAANNVIFTGMSTFIVFFYTDVVGVAAGIVGSIMMLSRIFDGIIDIVMGLIVDKTKSKHGKARPWLLWMSVPYAVSAVLLFLVPNVGDTGKLIYIIITYNLALLIYTAIEIPHGTLGSLISQDQHHRSVLNVSKMSFALVAIIAISMLTVPFVESFGGGQSGWVSTFILYGIIAFVLYVIAFKSTKERVMANAHAKDNLPLKDSVTALFKNKYWALMTAVFTLMYISLGITSGAAVYFAQYVLGDMALVGAVVTAATLAMLLGMGIVIPLAKKFGKRNTAIVGSLLATIGSLVFLVDSSNFVIIAIGQIIRGLGMAAMMGIVFAMLADTIEYGEWKTGIRIEGLVYSGASMGIKIGTGLGTGLIGWGLAYGGYVGGQATQSSDTIFAINSMFIYLPIIINLLMFVLLLFYKLDKQYPQIMKELQGKQA